jgi:glutathione S-transferase
MNLRLFDWAPSPFCMKIRTILNYKGVHYERVAVLGPSLTELLRRSNVRKVPALDVDGRMLIDSTDIAHEIERLFPEPAILPSDDRIHMRAWTPVASLPNLCPKSRQLLASSGIHSVEQLRRLRRWAVCGPPIGGQT